LAYPLNILFILGLVRSENDGALALIGLLLSSLICTAAAYLYAFRKVRFESIQAIEILKEIRVSSVIFLQSANATIITVGSTLLLSIYCNSEQVGYYGSVERLVSFAIAMLAPAAQVLMPTIAYFQSNAHLNANKLIAVGIALEVSYGFFIAIVCTLFSSIIINHVFGEGFQKSISIFKVFVWIMPFASLNHAIGMYALLPQNREKLLVYAVLLGNVVAIILVPVLTPALGSMGMVISRISCEAFAASILSVCWFVLPRKKLRTF
jgi:O-antigen/teichoic acid export membrane protein